MNISTTNYCTVIGSGVDFNSNPFTITINAGATDGRANVSVSCDNVTEGLETFYMRIMRLTVTSNSSGVTLGRDTDICEGQIIDSTGLLNFTSQVLFWGKICEFNSIYD